VRAASLFAVSSGGKKKEKTEPRVSAPLRSCLKDSFFAFKKKKGKWAWTNSPELLCLEGGEGKGRGGSFQFISSLLGLPGKGKKNTLSRCAANRAQEGRPRVEPRSHPSGANGEVGGCRASAIYAGHPAKAEEGERKKERVVPARHKFPLARNEGKEGGFPACKVSRFWVPLHLPYNCIVREKGEGNSPSH